MAVPKRRISEIGTKAERHPQFFDIFVEGRHDKKVFEGVIKSASSRYGQRDVRVYDVDTVEIDNRVVESHGLRPGKQGRVIALAKELDKMSIPGVLCVADKDFTEVLGCRVHTPSLLYTDYSCPEMYSFSKEWIEKFLGISARVDGVDVEAFYNSLLSTLNHMHAIRAANISLGWGLSFTDPRKNLTISKSTVTFDVSAYLQRFLNSGAKLCNKAQFEEEYNRVCGRLTEEKRSHVTKDDLFCVLSEVVRILSNVQHLNRTEVIEPMLSISIDYEKLMTQPLFRDVLRRLGWGASVPDISLDRSSDGCGPVEG